MTNEIKIKRLSQLYESCDRCGLSDINCICDSVEQISTETQFWILSSRREFYRPSNTARLMKLINPESTEVFLWERTNPPEALIKKINAKDCRVFILFPADTEDLKVRQVDFIKRKVKTAFILIDGTWKEAKRILHKAEYLSHIPIVALSIEGESKFDLRKGADGGQLCTIEAAIEVLKLTGEMASVEAFQSTFQRFMKACKASASGHKMKA